MPFSKNSIFFAAFIFLISGFVSAQSVYPVKPIRMIVPFPAGGVTDIGARIVSEKMATLLGQPIIIENRPGAGSRLGTVSVMKSQKDGYTLLFTNNSYSILPVIDADAGYDPEKDLMPVALCGTYSLAIVVNSSEPSQNLSKLIENIKNNPGRFTYGSAGIGSGTHFMGEHFKQINQIDLLHVPYKSTQLATQDVAAGRINIAFEGSAKSYAETGKIRIIAVTGSQRDPRYPLVPTVSESGLPEFTFVSWLGILAPHGVPESIVRQLNFNLNESINDPIIKKKLADLGVSTPQANQITFEKIIANEVSRYRSIKKNIKIE